MKGCRSSAKRLGPDHSVEKAFRQTKIGGVLFPRAFFPPSSQLPRSCSAQLGVVFTHARAGLPLAQLVPGKRHRPKARQLFLGPVVYRSVENAVVAVVLRSDGDRRQMPPALIRESMIAAVGNFSPRFHLDTRRRRRSEPQKVAYRQIAPAK